MRRQIAQDLGIVVPPIRIRDDINMPPNKFRVKLKGLEIGTSEVMPDHLLAINSGMVDEAIGGIETTDPAFGLPAVWIVADQRHEAEHRNYTVVECSSVLGTYLTELIKRHCDELLSRQEVNRLLENLRERAPKLIEELVPDVVKPGELQGVLQRLLRERVPIRDLETILETVGNWALFDRQPSLAAVRAVEDSSALKIDRENFFDLLADHSEINRELFQALFRRMRAVLAKGLDTAAIRRADVPPAGDV